MPRSWQAISLLIWLILAPVLLLVENTGAAPAPTAGTNWTLKHGNPVRALAFADKGKQLITGATDGKLRFWNLTTGKEIATIQAHDKPIVALAATIDGSRLVSAKAEGESKIWNVTTRKTLATFKPSDPLTGLAFHPGGKTILTLGGSNAAQLWDATSGKKMAQWNGLGGLKEMKQSAVYSRDGKQLVLGGLVTLNTGGHWSTLCWVDVTTGKEKAGSLAGPMQSAKNLFQNSGHQTLVALSGDGKQWAWADVSREIHLAGKKVLKGHTDRITGLVFLPDGKTLVSAGHDGTVRLWDTKTMKEIARVKANAKVLALAVSPDGKSLAWGTDKGVQVMGVTVARGK